MRILAVDDDPFILELLSLISKKAGFAHIATASSGAEALEVLKICEMPFECLLLDINMPNMDGIELCGHIRAIPLYRRTPIIMLTAMTERSYIDRAFKAGATDYASKPFDIVELGMRLRMAQDLNLTRKSDARAHKENTENVLSDETDTACSMSDGMTIDGHKNLVDSRALENYLRQLSRAGLVGSQVFAVKIHQTDTIQSRATAAEFLYALTEVIDAISWALRACANLMSYAGNGTFIIVSNTPKFETSDELESEFQHLLDEKNSEYDNGDPLDIDVSIGTPLRPEVSSAADMIHEIFDRAVARADARVTQQQNAPRKVIIRSTRSFAK